MSVDLVSAVVIVAVGQIGGVVNGDNSTLIWVAIFSFTIPSVIAAVTGAVATRRMGPHSTMQTDIEYVKRLLVSHVENKRIHQRRDRRDG